MTQTVKRTLLQKAQHHRIDMLPVLVALDCLVQLEWLLEPLLTCHLLTGSASYADSPKFGVLFHDEHTLLPLID